MYINLSLESALLFGLLAHFIGDYILQNDYIAVEKTKRILPAIVHVILYSVPFIFIVSISYSLLIITATHFLIDRFRLAVYWIKLINWNFKSTNFGFKDSKPAWMSVWLMILYDNIFHIIINNIVIWNYYN